MTGTLESFVRTRTRILPVPLCPEVRLHTAEDVTAIWEATEECVCRQGLPPPFWAFCWPGGQALARWLLDYPSLVDSSSVLDFGAGCGIGAIAASRAGADCVTATEIDPFAAVAMSLNAGLNDVSFDILMKDVVGTESRWDVVVAADVCYERQVSEPLFDWLKGLAASGVDVIMADPGRTYLPADELTRLTSYRVPTSLDLEDAEYRDTAIFRLDP